MTPPATLTSRLADILGALDAATTLADAQGDVATAIELTQARHLVHAAEVRLDRRERHPAWRGTRR